MLVTLATSSGSEEQPDIAQLYEMVGDISLALADYWDNPEEDEA